MSVSQQLCALAHGAFVCMQPFRMARINAEHKTIEQPASTGSAFDKQSVHIRSQPHDRQHFGQGCLASLVDAIDAHDPSVSTAAADRAAGSYFDSAVRRFHMGRYSPCHRLSVAPSTEFIQAHPTKASTRRKIR